MDRPRLPKSGLDIATAADEVSIALLGGFKHGAVCFTRDQMSRLQRMYEFAPEEEALAEAAACRNLLRHVEVDGFRVMAFLSRYLEVGEDPVRFLQRVFLDAGFDVPDAPDDM